MRSKPWAGPELDACPFFIRQPEKLIGNWHTRFEREQPMYLELGCGKGYFLAGAAPANPQVNYLGIDLKDTVLGPAKRLIEQAFAQAGRAPDNILLTAMNIEQISAAMNASDSVQRIYINFCNPWPRPKHHKRRLTWTRQLENYKTILAPGGEIRFKTDDDDLFEDSIGYFTGCGFLLKHVTRDLHAENPQDNILTEHEIMFLQKGVKIKALTAVFPK